MFRLVPAFAILALLGAPSARAQLATPGGSIPEREIALVDPGAADTEGPRGSVRSRALSAAGLGAFYVGLGTWAYLAWYHNVDTLPEFEIGGDGWFGGDTYAGGADKMGHFWANYAITRLTTDLLEVGGWRTLPASLIAGGLSWTFFFFVEIKDGFYYQLSHGDMVGNTLGVVLGAVTENVPAVDEVVDFRIEYFPSSAYRRAFREDGDLDVAEDYSGQTYLMAVHLKAFPRLTSPEWMRWARYVDIVGGFESRNYLPEPIDASALRERSLFLGFSLNLQHALDELVGGPPRHLAHRMGNKIFELYSPPYTTLRVSETTRREPLEAARDAE